MLDFFRKEAGILGSSSTEIKVFDRNYVFLFFKKTVFPYGKKKIIDCHTIYVWQETTTYFYKWERRLYVVYDW